MDRIIKYLFIVIIITSSVITILTATHESALLNVFLIGIGVLSIVAVLWCLVETLNLCTISVNLRKSPLVGGVSNPDFSHTPFAPLVLWVWGDMVSIHLPHRWC